MVFLIGREFFSIIVGNSIPNFKIAVKVLGTSVKCFLSVTVVCSGVSLWQWAYGGVIQWQQVCRWRGAVGMHAGLPVSKNENMFGGRWSGPISSGA